VPPDSINDATFGARFWSGYLLCLSLLISDFCFFFNTPPNPPNLLPLLLPWTLAYPWLTLWHWLWEWRGMDTLLWMLGVLSFELGRVFCMFSFVLLFLIVGCLATASRGRKIARCLFALLFGRVLEAAGFAAVVFDDERIWDCEWSFKTCSSWFEGSCSRSLTPVVPMAVNAANDAAVSKLVCTLWGPMLLVGTSRSL